MKNQAVSLRRHGDVQLKYFSQRPRSLCGELALSIWLFCALLLLLLTACAPAKLPPVVKIGLVAPFEGRYRYIGYDAIYAARLAVREINAQGGVEGRYLELVAYDDRGSPELARVVARNLIVDPAVVAVLGHYRQESTSAAQELYVTAQLPLLAVGAYLTRTSPYLWSLLPEPAEMAAALVTICPTSTRSAAIWGVGPLADALAETLRVDGYRLVPAISPRQAAPPPEMFFSFLPPQETGARWSEWRAAGGGGCLIGGPELAGTAFAEIAAPQIGEEVHFITPYPLPEELPGTEDWIAAYRAVGPHVPPPGPYALPTYEALYLLAAALAESPEDLTTALATVTRNGFLAEIALDARGYWAAPTLYHYQWRPDKTRVLQAILPPRADASD